jgi:hypothetical protein
VVTRRALLGAGALLIAGCGPPKATAVSRTDVLDEQLRLTQAAVAAGSSRARARARKLQAAGATAPSDVPRAPKTGTQAALAAERNALAGYVVAIGQLHDAPSRQLLGELVIDAAESEAELAHELDENPLTTAFPGQPS